MVRSERFSARMCRSNERARGERGGLSMTPQEVKPVMRCSSGTQLHEPAPDVKMTSISAGEGLVVGLPGLEPGTSSLSGMRSNRLSYRPVALGNVAQGVGRSRPDCAAVASELGDDGVGSADGDVVDAAATGVVTFGGLGDELVAEVGGAEEGDVAGGGDGDGAVGVAGEGEGGVGEEEDVAAVADAVAVEHGVADLHAGGGVAWGDVVDLDAEVAGGQVGLVHGRGGALGEGLGILGHATSWARMCPCRMADLGGFGGDGRRARLVQSGG